MLHFIGLFSGILAFVADIPYIIDTHRDKTQPHRTTWFLFFLLNLIFIANQLAAGARNSLGLVIGYTIASFLIAVLSVEKGHGGFSSEDIAIFIIALLGIGLWLVLKSPLASILANIFASFVATIPTIRKAWHKPESETKITWVLAALASLLGAFSIGKLDIELLLFPIYSVLIQVVISLVIYRRSA